MTAGSFISRSWYTVRKSDRKGADMDLLTLLKIYLCLASITCVISIWKSVSERFPLVGRRNKDRPKALPDTSTDDRMPPGE